MTLRFRSMFDINNKPIHTQPTDTISMNDILTPSNQRNIIDEFPPVDPLLADPVYLKLFKKWYNNQDASRITTAKRVTNINKSMSSLNVIPESYTNTKELNTVNDALARVRGGGSVVPPKVRAKTTNGLTPTWPIGDLVRTEYKTIHTIHNKMGLFGKPISANVIKQNH